ncbi:hypothetical protein XcuCFBP2542_12175 [Xanthomonas cucurbitae]|uniref:Uncharacterized protein n=1 Tax=Xanthomonas cucurbitae TaxID=56453 RepID=A0A2S7DQ07_9XANT|nr:hypothetical protein XcuCFBP2542_12175 [Xanthomonas cucurbitae]
MTTQELTYSYRDILQIMRHGGWIAVMCPQQELFLCLLAAKEKSILNLSSEAALGTPRRL